jgi:hypothetical protein
MNAVESRPGTYKGIRFRSQLEIMWAIMLDAAGVEWQFEKYALRVPTRLRGAKIKYLPDFYLPRYRTFLEIKGSPARELDRILALARGIAVCGNGHRFVIAGNVPQIPASRWPCELHHHIPRDGKFSPYAGLSASAWDLEDARCPVGRVSRIPGEHITPELLLFGFPSPPPDWANHGLSRARAAFPHPELYGTGLFSRE